MKEAHFERCPQGDAQDTKSSSTSSENLDNQYVEEAEPKSNRHILRTSMNKGDKEDHLDEESFSQNSTVCDDYKTENSGIK